MGLNRPPQLGITISSASIALGAASSKSTSRSIGRKKARTIPSRASWIARAARQHMCATSRPLSATATSGGRAGRVGRDVHQGAPLGVAASSIPKGAKISRDMLTGETTRFRHQPKFIDAIVGRIAAVDIDEDTSSHGRWCEDTCSSRYDEGPSVGLGTVVVSLHLRGVP